MNNADNAVSNAAPPSLRDRIVGAAFALFMERGYSGTSTLDIARGARVSKRDLYAEFGSKQAMLVACITERTERMRLPLKLPVPTSRGALTAALLAFGRTLLLEASRPEVLATQRLAITESERAPELAQTLDQLGGGATVAALTGVLAAAQERGLLAAGEPGEIADVFLALLWRGRLATRLLLRVTEVPDEAGREERARFAVDTVMRLYKGGAAL